MLGTRASVNARNGALTSAGDIPTPVISSRDPLIRDTDEREAKDDRFKDDSVSLAQTRFPRTNRSVLGPLAGGIRGTHTVLSHVLGRSSDVDSSSFRRRRGQVGTAWGENQDANLNYEAPKYLDHIGSSSYERWERVLVWRYKDERFKLTFLSYYR